MLGNEDQPINLLANLKFPANVWLRNATDSKNQRNRSAKICTTALKCTLFSKRWVTLKKHTFELNSKLKKNLELPCHS